MNKWLYVDIVLTRWLSVSFPLCREREIPCSSLEWVSHLIGPSTARHLLNSASTVQTTATSRRWVKRLYFSLRMKCDLGTRFSSFQFCLCRSQFLVHVLLVVLIWDMDCLGWGFWGPNVVCKALNIYFFHLITCLVMFVTKSFRAAASVYKSDVVLQATCLIILHKVWHIDVYSAANWQLI